MNGRRIKTYWEQDACTGWKRYMHFNAGARRYVKTQANRHDRRAAKRQIREEAP